MKKYILGALAAPFILSVAQARTTSQARVAKVYKAFDQVEIIPAIKEKPVGERLHILCGALAAYREAQGEDFSTKKLEADVAFFSAKKRHISACHEIARAGRYPWVSNSIKYIKPKNKEAWFESQRAALVEKENPKPIENVCNASVYKPSRKKLVFKRTRKLVFFNYRT